MQTIHVSLSKELYDKINRSILLHNWLFWLFALAAAALVSAIGILARSAAVAIAPAVIAGVVFYSLFIYACRAGYDQTVRSKSNEYDVTIHDDHIELNMQAGYGRFDFANIAEAKLRGGCYCLYPTSNLLVVVPRNKCTPQTDAVLKALTRRRKTR